MNKIDYFRKRLTEGYNNDELNDAANAGEALLREHWNNRVSHGIPYANDLFNLALVYDEMGDWERALEMYAESARLIHEEEGDSLEFVSRSGNMAALLNKIGRPEHAYLLYSHIVFILRMAANPKDTALADALYNLANASADIGKREEALRLHKEALTIRKDSGAFEEAVHSLHSLAFLHEDKKAEKDKALQYAKDAMELAYENMELAEPDSTREHNYYSACFYLAGLYEAKGDYGQAEPLYESVMKWTKALCGSANSAYLNAASKLANLLTGQKKFKEALLLHLEINEGFKLLMGEAHLFYANNLRSMAILHKKLGEYGEAEKRMLYSIRIRRHISDEITADALFLIEMHLQNNDTDKALEMLVYILMGAADDKAGKDALHTMLADTFVRAGNARLNSLSAAMEELSTRDRLYEVMKKWTAWEKEQRAFDSAGD
jgi:tetratricopeptide (TPR) repeat protein